MSGAEEPLRGNDDGCPLVAHEKYVFRRALCGVTIHYLETPAQLIAGGHSSLNLVLTAEMARSLAQALVRSAEEAEAARGEVH